MRLIDADKLIDDIDDYMMKSSKILVNPVDVQDVVNNQPTVNQWIPVSEKFPEAETEVEGTVIRKYKEKSCRFTCRAIYESGDVWSADSYLNWEDLDDSTYNEDKDDWLVPEGWFEAVSYGERFAVIDDKVIAWRELGKSYKGE